MTTPNDDLRSLINAASGASGKPNTTAQRGPTVDRAGTVNAGGDDLQALIAGSRDAHATKVKGSARPGSTLVDVQTALDLTLRKNSDQSMRNVRAPRVESALSQDGALSDVVAQATAAVNGPATSLSSSSWWGRRRVVPLALALALLLSVVAWEWQGTHPALSGHSATLHDLARSVEQYRKEHNGSLPDQLSNLEHFPATAVEWQVKHWKARDAAGRTEILWAPNGSTHYRIVLRQGDEVWIYSDMTGASKQTKP